MQGRYEGRVNTSVERTYIVKYDQIERQKNRPRWERLGSPYFPFFLVDWSIRIPSVALFYSPESR